MSDIDSVVAGALRDYVTAGEPPIGLRAPGVVAAGRRARRRRRWATAGGALFVAFALAAGFATVPRLWDRDEPAPRGDGFAAVPACPKRPGARPATPVLPDGPIPADVLAWALPTVTCYLADRVPRMLPAARFAAVPGAEAGPLHAFTVPPDASEAIRIDATALVRDDAGTGDLHLIVSVPAPSVRAFRQDACAKSTSCAVTTTADGATVLAWAYPRLPETGYAHNVVEAFRGQALVAVVASDSEQSMTDMRPAPTRPAPVLTVEQLTELALGSDLLLFP